MALKKLIELLFTKSQTNSTITKIERQQCNYIPWIVVEKIGDI